MRESDPNRYERIPGSARRYLDLETGESISRRQYDNRTKGEAPESGGDGSGGGIYYDDVYDDDDNEYYMDIISAGGGTRK